MLLVEPATVVGKGAYGDRVVLIMDTPSLSRPWRFSAIADDPLVCLFDTVAIGAVLKLTGIPVAHFNVTAQRYETRITAYEGAILNA